MKKIFKLQYFVFCESLNIRFSTDIIKNIYADFDVKKNSCLKNFFFSKFGIYLLQFWNLYFGIMLNYIFYKIFWIFQILENDAFLLKKYISQFKMFEKIFKK